MRTVRCSDSVTGNTHLPAEKVIVFAAPAVELVGKPIDKLKVIGSEARDAAKEILIKHPGKYVQQTSK